MRKVPLKSRTGCLKCRERRRKCDEIKPACGECSRLGFRCGWQTAVNIQESPASKKVPSSWTRNISDRTNDDALRKEVVVSAKHPIQPAQSNRIESFDHPAQLHASITSMVSGPSKKHVLQFLCEQGHSILRYPTQRYPTLMSINSFRAGFPMASHSPTQVEAYLCLGAVYLSRHFPQYEKVALKHYNNVVSALRSELQHCAELPPAEWTCAVAAILSRYEMIVFNSPQSRFAHLVGFHRLVEARVQWQQPWSPSRMLLEHYVHSLSDSSLFHSNTLIGDRPIAYLDAMLTVLNEKPRPLGRELVGVPEDLTMMVYKLAFLNRVDVFQSPWDVELSAVTALLQNWRPRGYALSPAGTALLLIGRLYHMACTCLVRNIWDRCADSQDETIASCLEDASLLVQRSNLREQPFNSVAWPLVIFGIFATDPLQRLVFKQPIENLVDKVGLKGYTSVLAFLSHISREGIGAEVLLRQDLLSIVHI